MLVICSLTSNAYRSGYALSKARLLKTKRSVILNGFWFEDFFLLVIDVIKPQGIYLNNWLQLSCRSSKFSLNSLPATVVLLCALLDSIRESAKCFQFFLNKHCMQVAKSSTIPSANDVIDLCWILHDKPRIFATFFFQPRNAFELFFIVPSLQISCFRKTKARKTVRLKISVSRPDLFDS